MRLAQLAICVVSLSALHCANQDGPPPAPTASPEAADSIATVRLTPGTWQRNELSNWLGGSGTQSYRLDAHEGARVRFTFLSTLPVDDNPDALSISPVTIALYNGYSLLSRDEEMPIASHAAGDYGEETDLVTLPRTGSYRVAFAGAEHAMLQVIAVMPCGGDSVCGDGLVCRSVDEAPGSPGKICAPSLDHSNDPP